jgi:archaeoflavoprotein AfpA
MVENKRDAGIKEVVRKRKVAWGVTGSGHRLTETVEIMKQIKEQYQRNVEITVYLSKAGYQVAKHYQLLDFLQENFESVRVEIDSNTPFLAGALQIGTFDFLLIAPATSNTVAKIATGIADSLLSNSASMALKAFVPVYIQPSDYEEGITVTNLPGGRELRLRMRRVDVAHAKKLATMDGVYVLEEPEEFYQIFKNHFRLQRSQ